MDSTIGHFRIALRMLAKRPGLTAARALTVTTVVTAVSAVFAVANATMLRPLPFPDAGRLVRVYLQPPGTTALRDATPLDPWEFVRIRGRTQLIERLEGIWPAERAVMDDGEPDAVPAGRVSAGFFSLLGGRTVLGRTFSEAEAESGAAVVVLGHGLWQRRFGGDRAVLGRTLLVDREPHTIIGVIGPGFEPAYAPSEFWTPLTHPAGRPSGLTSVRTIGLLRPGVTAAQANGEMAGLLKPLEKEAPVLLNGWTTGVVSLREAQFGSRRPAILMLLAAVAVLALIAIANLANLTLADVLFRRTEFAVRAALGGSRRAIAAPELAQSAVLAAAGGAAGIVGASWLVPVLLALDPSSTLSATDLSPDWRVVLCGFGAAGLVMAAAVAGPVLRLAGPTLASGLTAGSRRAVGGPTARRVRIALVTAQTALALVLISTGALVAAALLQATRTNPGFDPANVVTAQLRLSAAVFPTEADRATFIANVLDRLRATPGIVDAATTLNAFTVGNAFTTMVHIEDRPTPDGQPYAVNYRRVSAGYFETMRIRLVSGRPFDRRDWVGGQLVAIVSRSFARRFWAGQDPIGRRLKRGVAGTWVVVVGVAEDVHDVGIDQPIADTLYTPYFQGSNAAAPVGLVVRTAADPAASLDAIKRAVWAVDPKQPLARIVVLEDFLSASLGAQRFRATLVAVCGMLGLALATIGTYGVTARSVVERTREVGIRLALGGRPRDVWWSIAWTSLRAVVAGALAGAAASGVAASLLTALLPELRGTPWTFSAAAGGALVLIGGAAALIAARGATSVEPLRALAAE
jgi:putative ABC transport system permease protein